jgi:hypothetical protein
MPSPQSTSLLRVFMGKIKVAAATTKMPTNQIMDPLMMFLDKAKLLGNLMPKRIVITIINCSRIINRS